MPASLARQAEAEKRRAAITQMLADSGFTKFPNQVDLAKQFGVSQQQISHDIAEIKKKMPKEDPIFMGLQYDVFVKEAIKELENLRNSSEDSRSKREHILAINSLLRQRAELKVKLGLVEAEQTRQDMDIKIKWLD